MRANHSPLQLFGLIATATVLASGVYANAALAGTTLSTTESNGASASPALVGGSSASETGTRSLVDGAPASSRFQSDFPRYTPRDHYHHRCRVVESLKWPSGERLGDPSPASARAGHYSRGAGQARVANVRRAAVPALTSGSPRSSAATTRQARPPAPPSHRRRPRGPPRRIPHSPTPLGGPRSRLSSLRGRLPRRQPAATKPAATQPVAAAPPTSVSNATQPVATPPSATNPVATDPVATEPVATPALKAQSNQLSPGHPDLDAAPTPDLGDAMAPGREGPGHAPPETGRLAGFALAEPPHVGAGQRNARAGCRVAARPRR